MTKEQRIEWIKANAGKTARDYKHKIVGRIIGYRNYNGWPLIEELSPENGHRTKIYKTSYNDYYTWLVDDAYLGYITGITNLKIISNYKSNGQLKAEEIKRLEDGLAKLTNAPDGLIKSDWLLEMKERIAARIEEIELSGKDEKLVMKGI